MPGQTQTAPFIDGLYRKLVEGGIGYFFPSAKFDLLEPDPDAGDHRITQTSRGPSLVLNWLGSRYSLTRDEPFSESELKLLTSIGVVLDARYRMIVDATRVEQRFELFRGLPEDRHVSAFVDGAPYAQTVWEGPDRVEDAIEVLRTSSLSTYENRRISTGVLLFGKDPDPCHEVPVTPAGALRYSPALNTIRSFYRLCDGLQTLVLRPLDYVTKRVSGLLARELPLEDSPVAIHPTIPAPSLLAQASDVSDSAFS